MVRTKHLDDELVVILAALVVTNLVMTVPCIWGALVKSNPAPLLLWPAYCAVATLVEFGSLCALLGPPGSDRCAASVLPATPEMP